MLEVKKGSELHDRYVISDLLGSGGYAVVWRATDKIAHRDVAIKRMLKRGDGELERLLDEANKTHQLQGHKNIVEMYEVFQEAGEGFLVMEYVDGYTLEHIFRQHIRNGTWIDADEARDYFKQILQGLLFAHSSGLYHRDIKPSNILVSKVGVVKLVDFGLAKPMVPAPSDQPSTDVAGIGGMARTGTANFMSPEQANGEHLDHMTDIFSTGIVGYLLFNKRHPFNHPSGITSIFELIKDPSFVCDAVPLRDLKAISESEWKALMQMLCKDKAGRCKSIIQPLNEFTKEAKQQLCPLCTSPNPASNSFCGQCGGSLKEPVPPPSNQGSIPLVERTAKELTDDGFRKTQVGDWDGATELYVTAIARDPKYARAYANIGYSLNRAGRYREAIEYITKGIECATEAPEDHRLYDSRGFAKSNLKDYAGAIADFTKAIEYNRENPRVYYHRAESRVAAEQFEGAYGDLIHALRLDPSHPGALRLMEKLRNQGLV
jgi:serine/threonine protein kinase